MSITTGTGLVAGPGIRRRKACKADTALGRVLAKSAKGTDGDHDGVIGEGRKKGVSEQAGGIVGGVAGAAVGAKAGATRAAIPAVIAGAIAGNRMKTGGGALRVARAVTQGGLLGGALLGAAVGGVAGNAVGAAAGRADDESGHTLAGTAAATGLAVAARKGKLGNKAQVFTGRAQSLAEGLAAGLSGKTLSGTRRAATRGFKDAGSMKDGPSGSALAGRYGRDFDRGAKLGGHARQMVGKADTDSNLHKGSDSMDLELDTMLGMLNKSVLSILDAEGADREALLAKSLDQFADAVNGHIGAVAEASAAAGFDAGLTSDLTKLAGGDTLAKGMNHVAGFAMVLRQAEAYLEAWASEIEGGDAGDAVEGGDQGQGAAEPPRGLIAAAQWYQLGQEVLKLLVSDATGDEVEDAEEQTGTDIDGDGEAGESADHAAKVNGGESSGAPESEGNRSAPQPAKEEAKEPAAEEAKETPAAEAGEGEDEKKKPPFAKADGEGDLAKADEVLAKFEAMQDQLSKLAADNEALKKQLAATPAPAKGAVLAVDKAADSNALGKSDDEAELQKQAERLSKMSDEERALELMKMAGRKPIAVRHGVVG